MDKRILELRQKIDTLDEEIIQLLKKRMGISKEVGKLKEKLGRIRNVKTIVFF